MENTYRKAIAKSLKHLGSTMVPGVNEITQVIKRSVKGLDKCVQSDRKSAARALEMLQEDVAKAKS